MGSKLKQLGYILQVGKRKNPDANAPLTGINLKLGGVLLQSYLIVLIGRNMDQHPNMCLLFTRIWANTCLFSACTGCKWNIAPARVVCRHCAVCQSLTVCDLCEQAPGLAWDLQKGPQQVVQTLVLLSIPLAFLFGTKMC